MSPPPTNPISRAAHDALSTPWVGSADFRYTDDDGLEDSNDIGSQAVQPVPIRDPTEPESSGTDPERESSNTDSDIDGSDIGSSASDMGESPDIFETEADLNAAEYSKCPHHARRWN